MGNYRGVKKGVYGQPRKGRSNKSNAAKKKQDEYPYKIKTTTEDIKDNWRGKKVTEKHTITKEHTHLPDRIAEESEKSGDLSLGNELVKLGRARANVIRLQ